MQWLTDWCELSQAESISVGYKTEYEMYFMGFEEFLWAAGYDDSLKDEMLSHMLTTRPFDETQDRILNSLFLDYIILGGMPEVILIFLNVIFFGY